MESISIVIPTYNDAARTCKTIDNIFSSCSNKNNLDVIVVNDGSTEKYEIKNKQVTYIENKSNIGISQSRNIGILAAKSDQILTTDSHILFEKKGWDEEIIEAVKSNPQSILCFACRDLSSKKVYYAGGFSFLHSNTDLILNPNLLIDIPNVNFCDVPAVIGGAYAFSKNWYSNILGMNGIIGCGVGETFLSIKSYLAGGDCKLIKDIKIGHDFQKIEYTISKGNIYYNKIFLSMTILPSLFTTIVINMLPNGKDKDLAMELFKRNSKDMMQKRLDYEEIFKKPFEEYVNKFKLNYIRA